MTRNASISLYGPNSPDGREDPRLRTVLQEPLGTLRVKDAATPQDTQGPFITLSRAGPDLNLDSRERGDSRVGGHAVENQPS
jgi:hypothetical protein